MEKKIIAIVVALVVVVTAIIVAVVVSNNTKEVYVDDDGVAHWIYKDEEGNTHLNGDGEIIVYALDENGKRQKDENGEYIMAAIDFPEVVTKGNTLETPNYKLTMPKDWELNDDGIFELKKNNKITVKVNVFELDKIIPIDDYVQQSQEEAKKILDALKDVFPVFEIEEDSEVITLKNLDCRIIKTKMGKDKDNIDVYTIAVNFTRGLKAYQITLTCDDGSYKDLDKDIDLVSILDANFIVKDYAND